jgi:hypothetical protein
LGYWKNYLQKENDKEEEEGRLKIYASQKESSVLSSNKKKAG